MGERQGDRGTTVPGSDATGSGGCEFRRARIERRCTGRSASKDRRSVVEGSGGYLAGLAHVDAVDRRVEAREPALRLFANHLLVVQVRMRARIHREDDQ